MNKVLKKIYVPKNVKISEKFRLLHSKELLDL